MRRALPPVTMYPSWVPTVEGVEMLYRVKSPADIRSMYACHSLVSAGREGE